MNHQYLQKTGTLVLCLLLVVAGVGACQKKSLPDSGRAESKELPIYCVQTNSPKVAISFDAAWGNEDTAELLSILDQYQVKTTFFMTGGWVESFPDDVKAIAEAGHDLGNHSENHKQRAQLGAGECKE